MVKQKSVQAVVDLRGQYNVCLGTSVSEHTVEEKLPKMRLCYRRLTRAPLLTKFYRQLL